MATKLFGLFLGCALTLFSQFAVTSPREEIMKSRYMKYNFCMDASFGQGWRKAQKVPFGMNRWGVSEPTVAGIMAAPAATRRRDAECRKTNEIADEPRPRYEYFEKNNPD